MNTINQEDASPSVAWLPDVSSRMTVIEGSLAGTEGVLRREANGRSLLELADVAAGLFLEVSSDSVRMS